MAETIIALFLAHVLADYVLQTRWMVDTKRGPGFAAHIATVFVATAACLGQVSLAVVLITFAHMLIDAAKTIVLPDRLWSYLADQGLHLLSIAFVAMLIPGAWEAGLWAGMAPAGAPAVMAIIAGLIFATRAGHFAIAAYIASPDGGEGRGPAQRAALTGGVERGVVFAAVLGGVASLALVVLAAKAGVWWARGGADAAGRDRAIAATLSSFAWALAVAYATRALIAMP